MPAAKRPPWIAIVVISITLMMVGVGALLLLNKDEPPVVPAVNASDQLAGTMGEAATSTPSPGHERLKPLLEQIQARVSRQELFPPAADNALDLLKQARLLAPSDTSLRVVEEAVRLNCIEAIRREAQSSRTGIARRWTDRALETFPEDAQLLRFRDRLNQGLPI